MTRTRYDYRTKYKDMNLEKLKFRIEYLYRQWIRSINIDINIDESNEIWREYEYAKNLLEKRSIKNDL
jgi:hypothetical protein